jgi:hypothetical protein
MLASDDLALLAGQKRMPGAPQHIQSVQKRQKFTQESSASNDSSASTQTAERAREHTLESTDLGAPEHFGNAYTRMEPMLSLSGRTRVVACEIRPDRGLKITHATHSSTCDDDQDQSHDLVMGVLNHVLSDESSNGEATHGLVRTLDLSGFGNGHSGHRDPMHSMVLSVVHSVLSEDLERIHDGPPSHAAARGLANPVMGESSLLPSGPARGGKHTNLPTYELVELPETQTDPACNIWQSIARAFGSGTSSEGIDTTGHIIIDCVSDILSGKSQTAGRWHRSCCQFVTAPDFVLGQYLVADRSGEFF